MANRFAIESVIKAVDKVTAPMSRMANNFGRRIRQMSTGVARFNRSMTKMARTVGPALGVAGVAGALLSVKMAMGAVISTGADLEQTLVGAGARFATPIERTSEAFKRLEATARNVGARTEFTAREAAGGLNFMAKAGFSAAQSIRLLPGLVDLATASETDLARATDIASDSIGAFGLMTKDATQLQENFRRVSDQMAKTVNSTNTDMEQLFETIKKGAPAATAAGVPMETFLALTGRLANAGLKASDAGTALKNIFLKLTDKNVIRALDRMGVAVNDFDTGELRDFADIMDDLNEATAGRSKAQRAGIINQLFGLRGITGVATILSEGTEGLRKLRVEIEGSAGETERLAKVIRDTLTGDIKQLNSAAESLGLTLFGVNQNGIERSIELLTELTRDLDAFVNRNPETVKIALVMTAAGTAALIAGIIAASLAAVVAFVAASPAALVAAVATLATTAAVAAVALDPLEGGAADPLLTRMARGFGSMVSGGGTEEREREGILDAPRIITPQQRMQQLQEGPSTSILNEIAMTIRGDTNLIDIESGRSIPGFTLSLEDTGGLA